MCRMLIAKGKFSVEKIIENAIKMSESETAVPNAPVPNHKNGWGMVWRDNNSKQLHCYRNTQAIGDSYIASPYQDIDTDFLAIHMRHATVSKNIGLQYTHPLEKINDTSVQWYFMHNGFLPSACQMLGMVESDFDTREYCDYIIPSTDNKLDRATTLAKLSDLPSAGTAANAVIINQQRFYVINWSMKEARKHPYYMMRTVKDSGAVYIASEVLPAIAPTQQWHLVESQSVTEYSL